MSPANVLEPTYDALRRQLLSGNWLSGYRLEAARLASELGVSITPVRDCLNRLTGERLVHSSPGDGFQVPRLDETELRAMLDWHQALIRLALGWTGAEQRPMIVPKGHNGTASRTALLFAAIGSVAENTELRLTISEVTAKLQRYRHQEILVLTGVTEELDALEDIIRANDRVELLIFIKSYHSRRLEVIDRLVHLS